LLRIIIIVVVIIIRRLTPSFIGSRKGIGSTMTTSVVVVRVDQQAIDIRRPVGEGNDNNNNNPTW